MNDRLLVGALGMSLTIHIGFLPVMGFILQSKPAVSVPVPIEIVDVPKVDQVEQPEIKTSPPRPEPKQAKIVAPKLLSKPMIPENPSIEPVSNTKEETKPVEKPPEAPVLPAPQPTLSAALKVGDNSGGKPAEGSPAGAGNLFGKGDIGVVGGSGFTGGGGGRGNSGLGGDAKGQGGGAGEAAGLARPLGGYQVKPRYPESARRAGAHGTTLLKLRVLENGRVGEIVIEKSAGHRDLDSAAADAVKKWLFEPARMGKEPIAVWFILPVKFELQ